MEMALDIVTKEIEETKTSKHEAAATEDIKIENLIILKTIGTGREMMLGNFKTLTINFMSGKFARVVLSRHETTRQYLALKIMSMEDVIRLKQVEG